MVATAYHRSAGWLARAPLGLPGQSSLLSGLQASGKLFQQTRCLMNNLWSFPLASEHYIWMNTQVCVHRCPCMHAHAQTHTHSHTESLCFLKSEGLPHLRNNFVFLLSCLTEPLLLGRWSVSTFRCDDTHAVRSPLSLILQSCAISLLVVLDCIQMSPIREKFQLSLTGQGL